MKLDKASYYVINFYLVLWFMFWTIASPYYLLPLGKQILHFNHVELHYSRFTKPTDSVHFVHKDERYSMSCPRLYDKDENKFCDNRFPIDDAEVVVRVIRQGVGSDRGRNNVIIQSVKWKDQHGDFREFELSEDAYQSNIYYARQMDLIMASFTILPFVIAFYFYKFGDRKEKPTCQNNNHNPNPRC